MNLKDNTPFLLSPFGKDYIWGGERLKKDFNKQIDITPLAESWECSTHKDGLSMIISGEFAGKSLKEVLELHPEFLGTHPSYGNELPILVKFIDAKQDLSIQVHPDDEYALKNEKSLGKMEMWYVVDANEDASLIYGFHHDMNKQKVLDVLNNGTIENYVQKVKVNKDDVFFIEPGTIHAIGKGCLIAEIQQSSNITYRLYDYNRSRKLHIDKALDVLKYQNSKTPRQPLRTLHFKQGYATELLGRCKYFQVERMLLNTKRYRNLATIFTLSNSFNVYLCIDGCGLMKWDDGTLRFQKGDCIFVPANSKEIRLDGKATFLRVGC